MKREVTSDGDNEDNHSGDNEDISRVHHMILLMTQMTTLFVVWSHTMRYNSSFSSTTIISFTLSAEQMGDAEDDRERETIGDRVGSREGEWKSE